MVLEKRLKALGNSSKIYNSSFSVESSHVLCNRRSSSTVLYLPWIVRGVDLEQPCNLYAIMAQKRESSWIPAAEIIIKLDIRV